MEPSSQQSLSLMRDSLGEAETTVRAYDTKAQIIGIGYIFSLGITGKLDELITKQATITVVEIVVAWAVVVVPILLFGYVLYPTRKMAPSLAGDPSDEREHILYIDPLRLDSVEKLKEAAGRCDPLDEVAFELLKVSRLRETKRKRFLRALFAAGFCFVVLFTSQVARAL